MSKYYSQLKSFFLFLQQQAILFKRAVIVIKKYNISPYLNDKHINIKHAISKIRCSACLIYLQYPLKCRSQCRPTCKCKCLDHRKVNYIPPVAVKFKLFA